MELKNLLSKNDAITMLELIDQSLYTVTKEDLESLVRRISDLVVFDSAFCGFAKTDGRGNLKSYDFAKVDYPEAWIETYFAKGYLKVDPVLKKNFTNFPFQYWKDTYRQSPPPRQFISDSRDFGLQSGCTFGMTDLNGREGSIFSFAGSSIEYHPRTEAIIKHVVPHFNQALVRIFSTKTGRKPAELTPREQEILRWIKEGKSSWDISMIVGISARTVNYHVNNVKRKLDAVSRAQAVAIGVEQGLLDH